MLTVEACVERCIETGGDETECAERCEERIGQSDDLRMCFAECIEAGNTEDECLNECGTLPAVQDPSSCVDQCIDDGGASEECRQRCGHTVDDIPLTHHHHRCIGRRNC